MLRKRHNFFATRFTGSRLIILDQTKLPNFITYLELKNHKQVITAIKELKIRGAPLIGVAGAYGLSLASLHNCNRSYLKKVANELKSARPTAVNLTWTIDRMLTKINDKKIPNNKLSGALLSEASKIEKQENENSLKIGNIGAQLIKNNMTIMTICNTGRLAVPGIGTALGVIYTAHQQYKNIKVYVLETRPLLQGARLTAFELRNAKIPYTLITDNMMGSVMNPAPIVEVNEENMKTQQTISSQLNNRGGANKVDIVLVGADRIVRNGDTANKIGTLTLAITAHHYKVPFYVVAPTSSFDLNKKTGEEIVIEERDKKEIIYINNKLIAPSQSNVYNPAFDITPNKLITGIITEKGIIYPPYSKNIRV
jgi:methylthioribose-1-phosphate isomerase